MPLIWNVIKPLTKSVLITLGLTAASATDAAIHKKMFRSGCPSDTNNFEWRNEWYREIDKSL